MKTLIAIVTLLLMGCNNINTTKQMSSLPALPNELQLGRNVLSQDSFPELAYPVITDDQRMTLQLKSGLTVPDSTLVIGMREIAGKRTLEAYLVPLSEDPNDFKVYLTTRGSDGYGIHTLDLGRFHTQEHKGPMRLGGNRFYTHDISATFDSTVRVVVHHALTLTSIYLKNHTLTEGWRVEWDDEYVIDNKGFFTLKSQHETLRNGIPEEEIVEQYMAQNRPIQE